MVHRQLSCLRDHLPEDGHTHAHRGFLLIQILLPAARYRHYLTQNPGLRAYPLKVLITDVMGIVDEAGADLPLEIGSILGAKV